MRRLCLLMIALATVVLSTPAAGFSALQERMLKKIGEALAFADVCPDLRADDAMMRLAAQLVNVDLNDRPVRDFILDWKRGVAAIPLVSWRCGEAVNLYGPHGSG